MREIKLVSNKHPGLVALVDDEDFLWLNQYRWNVIQPQRVFYAIARIAGNWERMHRVIIYAPVHLDVDHVDHDGLHNWKLNLRLATESQNLINSRPRVGGSSVFKGVSWHKRSKKFQVQSMLDGKKASLGYFDSEIEAALVYNQFVLKHYGEFACLNVF